MSDRSSRRYAKFACSMCDYAGYTQPLLDAHLKLRGHGPVGGVPNRPGPIPAPLLGQRPGSSGLLGTYGSNSNSPGSAPTRPPTQQSRALPDPSSSLPGLFNQHQQSRPPPVPVPLLATPGTAGAGMTLTQDVVETTLAKFNLPPNAVPFKGLTSEEFLQRLEDELLKRMNPADIIKQKIDAIVHSAPSASASVSPVVVARPNQEQLQKQSNPSAKVQQHSESPPPISDTEELLAMALRHNDFKTARELTDLLEKEKELQSRKAALARLIPKSSAPGGAPVKLGEEVNMAESFKQYWGAKRGAPIGETSSLTEVVPSKRSSRWPGEEPPSSQQPHQQPQQQQHQQPQQLPPQQLQPQHQHPQQLQHPQQQQQRPMPSQFPPSSPLDFSFRKIELTPDSSLPSAFLTFMEADPTLFWIRQPDNETTFHLINQELIRLAQTGTLRSVERPAREGMGGIAIVNIENLWFVQSYFSPTSSLTLPSFRHHRVEVVEQLNNGDIRVRLIDDGRLALISNSDNLKYVPDADSIVARSPALGIPCSLVGFQPNEQWRATGEKCFTLFKQALGGAKSIKFVQKSQHGVYGVEVFSDKGQSLALFLAQRGIGFVAPSTGYAVGLNNSGPGGSPRLIRPPNGVGPPGPAGAPVLGLGPRGPGPFAGPRPMPGGFGGPMDAPRLPIGPPRPLMTNRPQFFDRR